MEFAFGVLKMSPDVFWKMTMIEFLAAFNGHKGTMPKSRGAEEQPITRDELEQLMYLYPD